MTTTRDIAVARLVPDPGARASAGTRSRPTHMATPQHDRPSAGLVSNYCRNPDGEPTIWCYTIDGDRWELCYPAAVGITGAPTTPPETPPPGETSGEITCGSTVTGDTTGATHVVGSSSGEHWYTITVTETQQWTFSTCSGSAYDTRLRLYAGNHLQAFHTELASSSSSWALFANDNSCSQQSVITFLLEPGAYTLIVEGFASDEGNYTVTTTCSDQGNSVNVHCVLLYVRAAPSCVCGVANQGNYARLRSHSPTQVAAPQPRTAPPSTR